MTTVLLAYALPVGIAVAGWLLITHLDPVDEYRDPFSRQLDEIRSLPETTRPYDWELEDA